MKKFFIYIFKLNAWKHIFISIRHLFEINSKKNTKPKYTFPIKITV